MVPNQRQSMRKNILPEAKTNQDRHLMLPWENPCQNYGIHKEIMFSPPLINKNGSGGSRQQRIIIRGKLENLCCLVR